MLNLTKTERLVLANQYLILAAVSPEEKRTFEQRYEIVMRGYVGLYSELDQWLSEEMSADDSKEVAEILNMFRALAKAKRDGLTVPEDKSSFWGFDGNEESSQYGYVEFLVNTMDKFGELKGTALNSHWPSLPKYRAMLAQWQATGKKYELTQSDVDRIMAAAK